MHALDFSRPGNSFRMLIGRSATTKLPSSRSQGSEVSLHPLSMNGARGFITRQIISRLRIRAF